MTDADQTLLRDVLAAEQRLLAQKLAVGTGFACGLALLAGWPAALVCGAVLWAGQIAAWAYVAALLGAPEGSVRQATLMWLAPLSHVVGAATYGVLAPGYWLAGGPGGPVVATLLLAANAQHIWLHYAAVPRLAVTGIACQLAWLLLLSLSGAVPGLVAFLPDVAAPMAGGEALSHAAAALTTLVFGWHLALSVIQSRALRGGARASPRRGRGGGAGEVGVPGQHEPRDPHAHERRDRHGRASGRDPARCAPARVRRGDPLVG